MQADFVLVCISQNYNIEATSPPPVPETEEAQKKVLHTSYVYELMQNELELNNDQNKRFIPLLFDGAKLDDIPVILQGSVMYNWPKQFRDVMWFLTKPDYRIKAPTVNIHVEGGEAIGNMVGALVGEASDLAVPENLLNPISPQSQSPGSPNSTS